MLFFLVVPSIKSFKDLPLHSLRIDLSVDELLTGSRSPL